MQDLRHFLLGSTIVIVIPFYLGLLQISDRTFSLAGYPIYAALYFGVMNALSFRFAALFHWSPTRRIIITSIFSATIVAIYVAQRKLYDFKTTERWILHFITLLIAHGFAFALIGSIENFI